jgi:HD superfamily phosphohydrolase
MNKNIVFPEKISYEIFKVYRTRYDLHKQFYNNKTVICIEYMLRTVLNKLDPILKITSNIKSMNIEHFINLTDSIILNTGIIIEQIRPANYEEIRPSIEYINLMLNKINERKIYKCLYSTSYSIKDKINSKSIIKKFLLENKEFNKKNIMTTIIKIGLIGGEKTHPFDNLYFYNKNTNESRILSKNEISHLISPFFQERLLFIIEMA